MDVLTPLLILVVSGVIFFLLHDQIYPSALTGKDADGNTITLGICPAPSNFEDLYKNRINEVCGFVRWRNS